MLPTNAVVAFGFRCFLGVHELPPWNCGHLSGISAMRRATLLDPSGFAESSR